MAGPRTRTPGRPASDEAALPLGRADEEAVIAQVSAARQAGDGDPQGVDELLRRAADRNRAALDRLAQ